MTGIFGCYNNSINQEKLCHAIKDSEYDISETTAIDSCLLGKLNLKSATAQKLNIKTENEITIVTCGEIYNEDSTDLQTTIINLYKSGNVDRLKNLNGSFAAALYDSKTDNLILISDRYGTIKMFYFYDENSFCFAPKIRPILQLGVKKIVRKNALFDFLIFGFLYGDQTFFEDIYQLPAATILEFSKGKIKHTQYWDYEFDPKKFDTRPTELLIDDLAMIWEKSVRRRIKKDEKIIIPLSGGYDSRAILAAALKYSLKEDITTFTFGEKGSYDYEIGTMVALKTGVKNISLEAEKTEFKNQYQTSFNNTECMIDATPYFAINGYQKLKQHGDIIVSGFMGGEIMGSLVLPQMMNFRLQSKRDYDRARNLIYTWRTRYDFKIVNKICGPLLKETPDYRQSFNQTTSDLEKTDSKDFINYCTRWLYKNEEWNYTSFCVLRFDHLFEYAIPFLDNDLVDFMIKVPPKLRLHKYLYKLMLLKTYPDLFTLPTKNDFGNRIDADPAAILLDRIFLFLKAKTNTVSNKIMKRNIFQDKIKNYIDYDDLIRTNKEYQNYMRNMIDKVKTREYFNPEYIEKIWQLHLKGRKNYGMLLGLLVTFELFLENYLDG